MSQYFEASCRPETAAGAIAIHLRVKTPGALAAAGATELSYGTMEEAATAAGPCTIRLRTAQGTRKMVASEAITKGNYVYAAASGKIAADGSVLEGLALEAATADGDVIEVMTVTAGSAAGGYIAAAQQSLVAGGGAVNVTTFYTAGASDAGGDAWTLADGTFPGQLKKIKLITDGGGDAVLTPTTLTGGTTITFADVGDYVLLLWDGDSWIPLELGNDADGATAPALA